MCFGEFFQRDEGADVSKMALKYYLVFLLIVIFLLNGSRAFPMCAEGNKIDVSETIVDSMSPWDFQVEQLQPDKKVFCLIFVMLVATE